MKTSCVLIYPMYVKLVEFTMVQVTNSVEDKTCFSMLAFMKSKLFNRLIAHLPLVVCIIA
jgi:hypothetical protein